MKSIFSNTLNRDTVPTYLCCRLSAQNVTLYGEVIYKSSTDRHLFGEQFYYQIGDSNSVIKADYVTVITFLIKRDVYQLRRRDESCGTYASSYP